MQFEDFDKKIKEAADHHHPAYNEKAWEKMENLLDRHMPEEKDNRRRFIFFLLVPLLLAGTAWLFINRPWKEKETIGKTQHVTPSSNDPVNESISATNSDERITGAPGEETSAGNNQVDNIVTQDSPLKDNTREEAQKQSAGPAETRNAAGVVEQFDATVGSPAIKKKKTKQPVSGNTDNRIAGKPVLEEKTGKEVVGMEQSDSKPVKEEQSISRVETEIPPANIATGKEDQPGSKKEEPKDSVDKKEPVAENPVVKNDKASKKKSHSLFLSVSTGPDVSSVGFDRPGKTKWVAGVGLGYTFNNRLTVRTGFYTARKIYSAGKEDYKPAVTPPNYNYLDNIDANCKVYEIPLSLTWHFGKSAKHNFFGSAGLSSYLMKEEVYDYLYKYPGNPPITYSHTYSFKNKNNHYFSVAGISAGYQRNISNVVSVMAEPYLKIPFSGVGNGNVKLNSAGILFSVTVKPFRRMQ